MTSTRTEPLPPLLIFSDDWGKHPSSCQHLTRHLLKQTHVCWVNTIGMRPPALDAVTLKRGMEVVTRWSKPRPETRNLAHSPQVLSPKMWPWFGRSWDRRLNAFLLERALNPIIAQLPEPPIAITTIPIVADLVGRLKVCHWLYYCVDDFSEWPGLDRESIQSLERDLIRKVERVVTVSPALQSKLAEQGRQSTLMTHGVDLDFWKSPSQPEFPGLPSALERPLVVFWGLVDERLDSDWVEQLDREMTQGTILLIGPTANPPAKLVSLKRVQFLPAVPFDALPTLAREASVLVMPYRDIAVTQAMQPLKLKEYMATGKPVVVRSLPSTQEWSDCLNIVDSPAAFTRAVLNLIETGLPKSQAQARRRLETESWSQKAELLVRALTEGLPDLQCSQPRRAESLVP